MKKIVPLLLALLLLGVCAGCGASPVPSAGADSTPSEQAPAVSAPAASTPEASTPEEPTETTEPAEPETETPAASPFHLTLANQDCYDDACSFTVEESGVYTFTAGNPGFDYSHDPVAWTVYALDAPFEDSWRYLNQAYRPVIADLGSMGNDNYSVQVALEAGQSVYVVCSVNAFTGDPMADGAGTLIAEISATPLLPCAENGYVMPVTIGAPCRADLDGDGTEEEIFYDVIPAAPDEMGLWSDAAITTLTVNGQPMLDSDAENPMEPFGFWMESPDTPFYFLVDLDASDGKLELALTNWGDNDWLTTQLFDYANGGLTYLGYVPSFPDSAGTTYTGDGSLKASDHLNVMQTWRGVRTFVLADGVMAPLEGEFFAPDAPWSPITLKQPLTVYQEHDLDSATLTLEPSPSPLAFPLTDGAHWVQIRCADGTTGWAYFEEFSTLRNGSSAVSDEEVFEGLVFAG
ncbi:MAG: hypothetical protein IJ751_06055 [Oscillospiraceae bacterium]|nr:hypothetical protein [Oscillospiraceae bacterium]